MAMRSIRVSDAAVRTAWGNHELALPQVAASIGVSVDTLQQRAARLGLAPRQTGRPARIRPHQESEFREMWICGVSSYRIAEHFRCSYFAVNGTARRLGLASRGAGYRPAMTIEQFRETRLARLMAEHAAVDRNAIARAWK